jgi:hypothetical protein
MKFETIIDIFLLIIFLKSILFFSKLLITKRYKVDLFNLNYDKNANIFELIFSFIFLVGLIIISLTTIQTILFDLFKIHILK